MSIGNRRAESSNAFVTVENNPRTVSSTALIPPVAVVTSSVTRSPTSTPRLRASPEPNRTPSRSPLRRELPRSITSELLSADSRSGLTASPTNDIVVSPWLARPEK